jgi:hypothetical protein
MRSRRLSGITVFGCLALIAGGATRAYPGAVQATLADVDRSEQEEPGALRVGQSTGPISLPAFIPGQEDTIRLRETSGQSLTIRVTPVDEQGRPVDGGRVLVLGANERRTVHLADTFPPEDLVGDRLVVEYLNGAGDARLDARWLTAAETAAVAAALHAPRRHLARVTVPSSDELIDRAEAAGTLDHETALVYKAFALFGDARLPAQYRGADSAAADSLLLGEIAAALPTMSPANQTLVQPFLTPPAYEASWASGPASSHLATTNAQPSCGVFASGWSWFENPGGVVRVWFRLAVDAAMAQAILDAVEGVIWPKLAGLMTGHVPLFDDDESCNGGSLTIDIYLVEGAEFPGLTTPYHSGGTPTPTYIEIRRGSSTTTTLSVVAHELFHAFQYSYRLRSDLGSSDYDWWAEASATWAEDYVYPRANVEHAWAGVFIGHPEKPLDYVDSSNHREYGAYLVPFYVYHKTGSAAFIPASWQNCAGQSALRALDAVLPGGFAAIWPEVALHDWNDKPVDQYKSWDNLEDAAKTIVPDNPVTLSGGTAREYAVSYQLPRLSIKYSNYNFEYAGEQVRSVAFWNGATFDLEKQQIAVIGQLWNPQTATAAARNGIKVQAVIEIEGKQPTVEDWTDKPYATYCRDLTAERLAHLSIIISNSELTDRSGLVTPPGQQPRLVLSNVGCWQWKGEAQYTAVGGGSTQSDATQVTWTRVESSQMQPQVTYQASGVVTVTMGGSCSGGGTFPVPALGSEFETYNFTPVDAAGARSYRGQSYDSAQVDITCQGKPGITFVGPWFQILAPQPPQFPFYFASPDGATLSGLYTVGGLTWQWELHAQRQP